MPHTAVEHPSDKIQALDGDHETGGEDHDVGVPGALRSR